MFAAAPGPPRRARHQRRRDVADRARHPLRRRPRHRAHLPLLAGGSRCSGCPIEKVSQASANQRAGRCGRVADGICIRLYAEDDFDARPEFTDPEILRTNLASVILQMIALDLGEHHRRSRSSTRPTPARSATASRCCTSWARSTRPRTAELTAVGRALAALPVDPRLGRMLVEADRNGCLREVLVIAAALSVQDPRERPTEQRQAADAKHARFARRVDAEA